MNASSSLSGFSAKDGLIIDDVCAAWCATEENEEQWLEVDLLDEKDVMAVALQGLQCHHSWVTTFYIQYSIDRKTWYCYGSANGHKVKCFLDTHDKIALNMGIIRAVVTCWNCN